MIIRNRLNLLIAAAFFLLLSVTPAMHALESKQTMANEHEVISLSRDELLRPLESAIRLFDFNKKTDNASDSYVYLEIKGNELFIRAVAKTRQVQIKALSKFNHSRHETLKKQQMPAKPIYDWLKLLPKNTDFDMMFNDDERQVIFTAGNNTLLLPSVTPTNYLDPFGSAASDVDFKISKKALYEILQR
jgi:hypothetical protein